MVTCLVRQWQLLLLVVLRLWFGRLLLEHPKLQLSIGLLVLLTKSLALVNIGNMGV
jgi:hypothetical protein